MDFHLPGMNGIEAFKLLRADPKRVDSDRRGHRLGHDRGRQQIIAAGFDELQTKPINVKEFLEAVAQTLKKSGGAA